MAQSDVCVKLEEDDQQLNIKSRFNVHSIILVVLHFICVSLSFIRTICEFIDSLTFSTQPR